MDGKVRTLQKKCIKAGRELVNKTELLKKKVKNQSYLSEERILQLVGSCMVNQAAPSFENAFNSVFSLFVEGFGKTVEDIKVAASELKEAVEGLVDAVETHSAEQSQASILDSLLRDNHANEIIQFVVDNCSDVTIDKVVAHYKETWIDEVSDPMLLLEFANNVLYII